MSKRISKVVLGFVTIAMILTSVTLGFANKDKSELIDIYGKREELGDLSIVYQEKQGYYKTKQVNITKDGLEVDEFAKAIQQGADISNFSIENRDLLQYIHTYYNKLYSDDKSLGYVEIIRDYGGVGHKDGKIQFTTYVREKNLDSNKIKDYEIPLDFYEKDDNNSQEVVVPIKYNGELFIVIGYDSNPDYREGGNVVDETSEDSVYGAKDSRISVFKLNTKNETSEHIFTKSIGEDDELMSKSYRGSFCYKDTVYILNNAYKLNREKKYDKTTSFLTYNIATKKFEEIELDLNIKDNHNIYESSIDGNMLTLISGGEYNDGKLEFNLSKIDLETNKMVENNEKYEIVIDDNNESFSFGLNDFREVDDKMYLTIGAYEVTEKRESINKRYVVVLDKESKETLYIGKLHEKVNGNIHPRILTKDEL